VTPDRADAAIWGVQRAIEGVRYAITGVSPETWSGPCD